MTIADDLRAGRATMGVVGIGYIGFSTACYFARKGVPVVGYDTDTEKVRQFNAGQAYIDNILFWVGFDFKHMVESGMARATSNKDDLSACDALFIAVPTERNGDPYMGILEKVVEDLAKTAKKGALVIVESTLTPGTAQKVVVDGFAKLGRSDILCAVAPRRDWFVESDRNMLTIPRVVGGATPEATKAAAEVLGIVCETVLPATSHKEAELIKSVENAYRCMDIVLANQLCFGYPDVNMREVLHLVGSKWNMNSYYPNLGIGGYCILPAPKYVLGGAPKPDEIRLLQETVQFGTTMTGRYAEFLAGYKNPLVLGVAYKGGLKVHVLSPGLEVAKSLIAMGKETHVADPLYTEADVEQLIPGAKKVPFPSGLGGHDLLVVAADHPEFVIRGPELLKHMSKGVTILDVFGIWARYDLAKEVGANYVQLGEAGWQDKLRRS